MQHGHVTGHKQERTSKGRQLVVPDTGSRGDDSPDGSRVGSEAAAGEQVRVNHIPPDLVVGRFRRTLIAS